LLYFHKSGYSIIVRFSMWFCYKFTSITWYRELYMKPKLEKIGAKNLFFLHNAIKMDNTKSQGNGNLKTKKDITFLWLNRVIPERRYEWFIEALKKKELKNTVNYLVGLIPNSVYIKEQNFIKLNKPENLTIEEYTQVPSDYFKRAKFFVLPAEVVFANNALLEAMSYGVVPLVSNQPGVELIVEHGRNGFIFQHKYKDFEKNLMDAYNLEDDRYSEFSAAAIDKIITDFSEENYIMGIKELYSRLNPLPY
ncbi:MAG: glycosyltransferase, partial [Ginsengibacter sp.]